VARVTTRAARWIFIALISLAGCDDGGGGDTDGGVRPGGDAGTPEPPGPGCNSVRLTRYAANDNGWCEMPRSLPILPAFVRDEGLTAAIAEPFNNGDGGEPGEACGECWEVDTIAGTRTVMITDLCPNDGNPLCQGAHFHLDVSEEASAALNAGFLDEGQARRVPCPVDGNLHVLINDENVSYLRLQFVNHRVPIRSASIRSTAAGSPEVALRRSGGAWEAVDDTPLDRGGDGVTFTITSAQGQTVESTVVVPTHPPRGSTFDLGVQLDDLDPPTGGSCEFVPPGEIFDDGFGGIEDVRWQIDPWGEAEMGFFGPVTDGCFDDDQCLRIETLGQYSGLHLYYRQAFPTETFSRVVLQARASAPGRIVVVPSHEGARCAQQMFDVGPDYAEISIDVAAACGGLPMLNALTIDNPGDTIALTLDDVRYER